jgi:phospholipid/cholesterol/gamma-HCH transport system permease protein
MPREKLPTLSFIVQNPHACQVFVQGAWLIHVLAEKQVMDNINMRLLEARNHRGLSWDLTQITALDHAGAQMLWQAWGSRRPDQLQLNPLHAGIFDRLEQLSQLATPIAPKPRLTRIMRLGTLVLGFFDHLLGFTVLLGQFVLDCLRFARHPSKGPWKELSANIYRTGFQALGITALVGMLIGVVLSYLSAQQLSTFGGDLFIVNILGMSIVRELGPMLAAILIAGRSGSAITAQIGVMRVTEELDAMKVMGIPLGFRLIMPKVLALALSMPLIVIWTDVMALIGGMLAAQVRLGMSPGFFVHRLPEVVQLANYWIGLGKGVVFGILIALVACHFGLRIQPNTESLGQGTTSSVVTAITVVIIADAVFAIVFSKVGY